MEKLKVGDKVYCDQYGEYTFTEVVQLTKTCAKLKNGDVLTNIPKKTMFLKQNIVYFVEYGGIYKIYALVTDETIQKETEKQERKEALRWFKERSFSYDEIIKIKAFVENS